MPLLLIYATKLLLIKTGFFRDTNSRTPCSWMHSTTGRGRHRQSLDSDVLADKKSASTTRHCKRARTKEKPAFRPTSGYLARCERSQCRPRSLAHVGESLVEEHS
jgi:hypothetical protein